MGRLKLAALLMLSIFTFLLSPSISIADKVLVNIEFNFMNIAASGKTSAKRKPEGITAVYTGEPCVSDSEEGMLPVGKEREKFPYKNVIKHYDAILKQTKQGRRVSVKWNLVNYEFSKSNYSEKVNGYHLFDVIWFGQRLDYKFKKMNEEWTTGFCLPTIFYFQSPSKATIKGSGDVDVIIPGFAQKIRPEILLWDIEKVVVNDNYRILVSRYRVPKQLLVRLDKETFGRIQGKKLEISGRATLGDSAIKTEVNPFWYPFDQYSFQFIFESYYPSDVTINIADIEDLNLTTPRKIEFEKKKEGGKEEIKIIFFRKGKFRNHIWPIIAALIPLVLALFPKTRRWTRWWLRLILYVFALGAIYFTLSAPVNVPKLNIFNLSTAALYLGLIICLEHRQWKYKREENV